MTLENCKRLLKHFEDTNQKERADEMRERVESKEKRVAPIVEEPKEEPKEEKKSGKKSKG